VYLIPNSPKTFLTNSSETENRDLKTRTLHTFFITITNGINYHIEQMKLILLSTKDFSRQNRVPIGFAGTIKSSSNRREDHFQIDCWRVQLRLQKELVFPNYLG
jgi:hypothetical protein